MSPLVLLLGSLAYSLAFNVAWAWGSSPLSVGAAAACTLIVPAALHLWPMVPATNAWVRMIRALVMTGICAAAAITSFQHAVAVLLDNHWTELAAWSVTGGAELLTTLSTMALRAPAPTATRPKTKPGAKEQKVTVAQAVAEQSKPEPVDAPEPTAKVHAIGDPKPWSARAQELVDEGVPRATAYRRAKKEHERVSA